MPYTTLQELTDRYSEQMLVNLTDRAVPGTGEIDQSVIDRAISDTGAMIDGYLAGRYRLPLDTVPDLLADLAQAIAIYKLHVAAPDPKIEADYRDALKTLRDISQGVVLLQVAGIEPAAPGTNGVKVSDRERLFTSENLKGYI